VTCRGIECTGILTDPKITFLVQFLFFFSGPSYPDNAVLIGERVSSLVCTVESKASLREYDVVQVIGYGCTAVTVT
jgi:hypothetical protein